MEPIQGAKSETEAGQKHKIKTDLSQNSHIFWARACVAAMIDIEKKIERAKNADRQAMSRAINKIKSIPRLRQGSLKEPLVLRTYHVYEICCCLQMLHSM